MLTSEQIKEILERKFGVNAEKIAVPSKTDRLQSAWQEYDMQNQPEEKSIGGFIGNIPGSAAELAEGIISTVAHPVQTIKGLGRAIAGGIQSIPGAREYFDEKATEKGKPILEQNRQAFQGIVDYFGQRYGGGSPKEIVENIGNTAYKDPVGFAFDLSILLQGGGGIVKQAGVVSKVKQVEMAGRALETTGRISNPITQTFNISKELTGLGVRTAGDLVNKMRYKLTQIPKQVQTIAKETTIDKLNEYAEQGYKAIKDPREITPLELAGQKAMEAFRILKQKLSELGEKKKTITKTVSEKAAYSADDTTKIINDTRNGLREDMPSLGLTFMKDGTIRSAPGRMPRIPLESADIDLLKNVDTILKDTTKKPTIQAVDDAIDSIQEMIYKRQKTLGAEKINTEVQGIIQKRIGELNSAIKKLGGVEYTETNVAYAKLLKLKNNLAQGLGKDAKSAGSFMKRFFSPADAATKKLFKDILDATGIDLAKDTTLAKFIMDAVEDIRQTSLLEKIPLSKQSAINKIIDYLWKRIQISPIEKVKDIIRKEQSLR